MFRAPRGRFVIPALGVALVLAGGCGSDGSASDGPAASTSASSASSSTSPSAPPTAPPTSGAPTTTVVAGTTLVSFADPGSVTGWSTVNDTVMGGLSASFASWAGGALVFAGDVSLANNGGFTSVVSPIIPGFASGLSGAEVIEVEGSGDGRTYVLQLRAGGGRGRLWTQPFTLPVGTEGAPTSGVASLPLGGFVATDFMLDPVAPEPVDTASIEAVAIYLVDGQEGPFRLALAHLVAR